MEKYNESLAHAGNYRYYAKEGKGSNARYFYSKDEYDAWRNGWRNGEDTDGESHHTGNFERQQDRPSRRTLPDKSTMPTRTAQGSTNLFGRTMDAWSTTKPRDARIPYVQQARPPIGSQGTMGFDPTKGVSKRLDSDAQGSTNLFGRTMDAMPPETRYQRIIKDEIANGTYKPQRDDPGRYMDTNPPIDRNKPTHTYNPTYTMPQRNTPTETRYQRIIKDEIANGTYKPQRDDPGRYNDTRETISLSPDYPWNMKYLSEHGPSLADQAINYATVRANSTGPAYAETSATAAQKFVGDVKRTYYSVSSSVANSVSKAVQSAGNTIGAIKNYASQITQSASSWIQNLLKKK